MYQSLEGLGLDFSTVMSAADTVMKARQQAVDLRAKYLKKPAAPAPKPVAKPAAVAASTPRPVANAPARRTISLPLLLGGLAVVGTAGFLVLRRRRSR